MLRITGIELELISDIDMHLFVEKGIWGAISDIAKRYSKANHKYRQHYDSSVERKNSSCILMQIIYMVGQCVNISPMVHLSG